MGNTLPVLAALAIVFFATEVCAQSNVRWVPDAAKNRSALKAAFGEIHGNPAAKERLKSYHYDPAGWGMYAVLDSIRTYSPASLRTINAILIRNEPEAETGEAFESFIIAVNCANGLSAIVSGIELDSSANVIGFYDNSRRPQWLNSYAPLLEAACGIRQDPTRPGSGVAVTKRATRTPRSQYEQYCTDGMSNYECLSRQALMQDMLKGQPLGECDSGETLWQCMSRRSLEIDMLSGQREQAPAISLPGYSVYGSGDPTSSSDWQTANKTAESASGNVRVCHYRTMGGYSFSINQPSSYCAISVEINVKTMQVR